ncbi:MAG: hypothetical protein Q7S43_01095 [bacterium]|nr:hypothetical protein [bacterium]
MAAHDWPDADDCDDDPPLIFGDQPLFPKKVVGTCGICRVNEADDRCLVCGTALCLSCVPNHFTPDDHCRDR